MSSMQLRMPRESKSGLLTRPELGLDHIEARSRSENLSLRIYFTFISLLMFSVDIKKGLTSL